MTMMPPKNKVSAPWPTPSNADARQGLGDQYDVVYEMNEAPELDIAAASTMDIGGQSSQRLRLTSGAAIINSFGTNYRGPIYIRSAVSVTIKNGPYLVCQGGVDLVIVAGDALMTWPKATGGVPDGWQVTTVGKIAASIIPSGTVMLFAQASAPTGWTQVTTHHNKALRVINTTTGGGSAGGSVDFDAAFTSQPVTGSNSATTLTIAQMPAHSHPHGTDDSFLETLAGGGNGMAIARSGKPYPPTGNTGGGNSHNHTFTGTAINLAVKYVNLILASKN